MGLSSVITNGLGTIKKIRNINSRVTVLWKRRVLNIAEHAEGSKEKLLEEVVSSTVAMLIDPARSDPFQRNQTFQESDTRLDELQAPEKGRIGIMEDAAKRDLETLEDVDELHQEPAVEQDFEDAMEVDEMCQKVAHDLRRIHDRLPTERNMQVSASEHDRQYVRSTPSFNRLQSVIVSVLARLEAMRQKGLIDTNLPVVVFDLEESDPKEAISLFISPDYTFADVAIDLAKSHPTIQLPDFWIKKIDEHSQRVICWEYQTPRKKVCEVPARNSDLREIDIVIGKDSYYIVVLIVSNGTDMGRAVELPPAKMEVESRTHMEGIFGNTISSIEDLETRSSVAGVLFNRQTFLPFTNPLRIELV